ncbi:unnamed protein product [Brassica rapa subsp. trilocularis]
MTAKLHPPSTYSLGAKQSRLKIQELDNNLYEIDKDTDKKSKDMRQLRQQHQGTQLESN